MRGAAPGPRGPAGPAPGRALTGHGLLVADALIEAAAELLAAVPADVVVAYVVERDVAHCKADRHTEGVTCGHGPAD